MSSPKKPKHRGRPPKYVRDHKGRDIVGLSYHKSVNQYYLTFSSPRVYLGTNRKEAIEAFRRQKQYEKLPPEAQEEAKRRDEIYQEALELLEYDECIQEQLRQKAREELDRVFLGEAQYIATRYEACRKAVKKKLSNPATYITQSFISSCLGHYFTPKEVWDRFYYATDSLRFPEVSEFIGNLLLKDSLRDSIREHIEGKTFEHFINDAVKEVVDERIKKEAEKLFGSDKDSLVLEMAYELILEDPVRAAMVTGLKELAYLALCPAEEDRDFRRIKSYTECPMPLPWWLVWEIYVHHVSTHDKIDEKELDVHRSIWKYVGVVVGVSSNVDTISRIQIEQSLHLDHWGIASIESQYAPHIWKEIMDELRNVGSYYFDLLSRADKREALLAVAYRVLNLGYRQCSSLCSILESIR